MDIEQGTRNSLFAMTITEKKIGSEQDGADAVTPSTSPDGAAREKVARKISHAAEEALHAVQKNLSGDFEDAVPRVEQNALLAEPEEHERALLAEYADAEKLHKKACETIDELARRLQGDAATPRPSEGLVAQLREQLFDLQSTNRALLAERMGHEPRRNRNYAWARATKFDIRERPDVNPDVVEHLREEIKEMREKNIKLLQHCLDEEHKEIGVLRRAYEDIRTLREQKALSAPTRWPSG